MHLFYLTQDYDAHPYRINPKITVKFKGHDTQVYNYLTWSSSLLAGFAARRQPLSIMYRATAT